MNHANAAMRLAILVKEITHPNTSRWRKEQLEIQAKVIANDYIRKTKEAR